MADEAYETDFDWLEQMDWLPVEELPSGFAEFLPFPPVLAPIPAEEWDGPWDPPYPIVLFDRNKRTTITDVYGMSAPDRWGRIEVTAEDELFRARFPHTAPEQISTYLVDIERVWVLEMRNDQSVYWSADTPDGPGHLTPDKFNFDHHVPLLEEPPAQPQTRILTRAMDQLGVLTGRRGWYARVEPNAWEACVTVSEMYCAAPTESELEALRRSQPNATFKLYVRVMRPVDYWLHRLTGEPMPSHQAHAHRVWM